MLNFKISWSLFKNGATDNRPIRMDADWKAFCSFLSIPIPVQKHLVDPKASTPAFSGAVFPPNASRCIANVESIQLLNFDFDNKHLEGSRPTGQEVAELLDSRGTSGLIYNTYSSTTEKERFRVVVPLAQPVRIWNQKSAWVQLAEWALNHLGLSPYRELDGCIDLGSLHNPAGLNFMPCNPDLGALRFWRIEGSPLALSPEEIRAFQVPAPPSRAQGQTKTHPANGQHDPGWLAPFDIDFRTLALRRLLEDQGMKVGHPSKIDGGWKFRCQCPWGEEHSQVKNGMDAYIQLRQGRFPTFHCSHSCHCDTHSIKEVAEHFGPEVLRRYAQPAAQRHSAPLLQADGLI